jgi:acyl-coenzyme A synthetase/AMP-(fatty) acid ligase
LTLPFMNITDPIRRQARTSPDREAIGFPKGQTVSYRELDRTIDFVAAGVRRLGLEPGAAVDVKSPWAYRDLCCRLALARLGICIAAGSMPAIGSPMVLIDGAARDVSGVTFERLDRLWPEDLAAATKVTEVPSHQNGAAVCILFPTSGTTGIPKLVAVSHDVIASRIASRSPALRLPGDARQICTIGVGTSYGFLQRLGVLWAGGVVVMPMGEKDVFSCADRNRATHLAMSPFSLHCLVNALPAGPVSLPSLRQIEVVGGFLPRNLYDIARQRLCSNIVSQYGSAEAGPVAGATIHSLQGHPGAVGYLYPGVDAQAVDADDRPLPPGTEGALRVRSAGCVNAYVGDPAASAGVFRSGWVYPGDVGSVAADGMLIVTGRSNEVINQGGNKVNPQVIEEVLLSVPGISEAAAFDVPDALGVARIWAAIVPSGSVDMDAVRALCRERLRQNAPRSYLKLKALPRNGFGKVLRAQLKQKAISARARRIAAAGGF